MVIMSGCSSVTRSFNSSCLFVMLLIFSCRSVKSFLLECDVVACECVVELSVVVWVVRAEGGSLLFWGPGLLSTSPAFSMSSASHSAGSSGWLAQKTGAGPTFQWAGKVDAICRSRSNGAKRPSAGCILRSWWWMSVPALIELYYCLDVIVMGCILEGMQCITVLLSRCNCYGMYTGRYAMYHCIIV